jgi:hypothetical protein
MSDPTAPPLDYKRKFYPPRTTQIILSCAAFFGVINGLLTPALTILIPMWIWIAIQVWVLPIATVTPKGLRRALLRRNVDWREVTEVFVHQRGRRAFVRVRLANGRIMKTGIPAEEFALVQHFVYWAHVPPPSVDRPTQ